MINSIYNPFFYNFLIPFIPPNCEKPPTIYEILNSIVNGEKEEDDYSKIIDLAREGRNVIFNFNYPLSQNIKKEDFEIMILNHYLMRRINFDTVTAFRIQLNVKLNEIMPLYNKFFDALENWEIFNDGEKIVRSGTDDTTSNKNDNTTNTTTNTLNNKSNTNTQDITDKRFSDMPQNRLSDIRDGNYVTSYTYDNIKNNSEDVSTSDGTSKGTTNNKSESVDNKKYTETITKTPADKISIYKELQENIQSIYTMIFKELDVLFYQVI